MTGYALWVDVDGTLVDYDGAVRRAVAEFVTLHDEWRHADGAAVAAAWAASRRGVALDGSRPLSSQRTARLAAVARRFDVRCDDNTAEVWAKQLTDLAASHCRAYPDVDQFLEQTGTVGVITNGDRSFQQAKLIAAGLDLAQFDPFVASIDVGAAKPSPAIYVAAARARGVAPSQSAMIGDSPNADVAAALEAGFAAAILIDRSSTPRPGAVSSLTAALSALQQLGIAVVKG